MAPRAPRAMGGRRWNWLHQAVHQKKSGTLSRPTGGFVFTLALLTKLIIVAIKVAKITAVAVRVARTAATIARAARALRAAKHAVTFARRLKGVKKTGEILKKVKRVMDKADAVGDLLPDGPEEPANRDRESIVVARGQKPKAVTYRKTTITPSQLKKLKSLHAHGRYLEFNRMRKRIENKWTSV